MQYLISILVILLLCFPSHNYAQNCCAPTVPQQGVLGETVSLPYTLEVGIHYEVLSSRKLFEESQEKENKNNKEAIWKQATLSVSYGIIPNMGIRLITPFKWKQISWNYSNGRINKNSRGIGDITCMLRYSLLPRDFVNYRELSVGLGVKAPIGSVESRDDLGILLSEELQPGTGSWDYNISLSFYQGFELVDFTLSGIYNITNKHNEYEFGNQFSYLVSSNFHLYKRFDLSIALSGMISGKDTDENIVLNETGRNQLWLTPGIQYQVISNFLRFHVFYEIPVYQHVNGVQLGSSNNIRITLTSMIPLKKSDDD